MFDLLDPKPVEKLLKEHESRRHDNHKLLFSLVMFEQWLRVDRFRTATRDKNANRAN
jgi:asparagine synthase (glutamine-hydrolysing)